MNSVGSANPKPTSPQAWAAALQEWQTKRMHYQITLAQTSEPTERSGLELGLKTCENVIQTCQELLQVLDAPMPDTHQHLRNPSPSHLAQPGPASPESQRRGQVLVALFLMALTGFAIFRPRNVCKIAPDGSHRSNGLVRWVEQALQADRRYTSVSKTVYIAQTGCTIHLRGTVSSPNLRDELVRVAQNVEVPSQGMTARIARQLRLGETQWVKPVQKVVVDLKIESHPSPDR